LDDLARDLRTAHPVTPPPTVVNGAPTALQAARRRGRVRSSIVLLGPAFVAAIAYVDPGNFATNFSAGAQFGYLLVWVIVVANAMAMLIQSLSGKIGLATGRNLPELCREHFPRPVTRGLWVQAELVAMATDLAEIIGGAIALNLLFGLPLLTGGVLTAVVAFALLSLQGRGHRPFELAIAGLFGVIALGFAYNSVRAGVDGPGVVSGLVPSFAGTDSVLLATGILGATVMPHVIYLHSALTAGRIDPVDLAETRTLLRHQRIDVVIAMGIAGLVNLAMLVLAARLFFGDGAGDGVGDVDTLEGVHAALDRVAGAPVALAFAVALLASGFASSGVGTYAGQVVMQGFLQRQIPLTLRRAVTMAPALLVLAVGVDPTQALVLSQVVLSFGIPFALVPLVLLTRRVDVMGALVNRPTTTAAASVVAAVVIALNLFLLAGLLI
jgi:manganese transport protein